MQSQVWMGAAVAFRRFRFTKPEVRAGVFAGVLLASWSVAAGATVGVFFPEALGATWLWEGILRSAVFAFVIGCLLLVLQATPATATRWDGLRAWLLLSAILLFGLLTQDPRPARSVTLAGMLALGALPVSLWLADRRRVLSAPNDA